MACIYVMIVNNLCYLLFFNILLSDNNAAPAIITNAPSINIQAVVVILTTPFYFII